MIIKPKWKLCNKLF